MLPMPHAVGNVVIIGSGPGAYEAALVARQIGAEVILLDRDGIGGSAVITDCVPSKALIAVSNAMQAVAESGKVGVLINGAAPTDSQLSVNLKTVNARVRELAQAQSKDITANLVREGVQIVHASGSFVNSNTVLATFADGTSQEFPADIALIATGARPRVLDTAIPDGQRILTWEQLYELDELPTRLIVVGSGVTEPSLLPPTKVLDQRLYLCHRVIEFSPARTRTQPE